MKIASKFLALVVVMGLAGVAAAKNAPTADGAKPAAAKEGKAAGLRGTITKIDGAKITVKSGHKTEEKEVVVTTDDKTTVTIEGKDGKLADLKEGQHVVVTPAEGTATHIEVPAHKPK